MQHLAPFIIRIATSFSDEIGVGFQPIQTMSKIPCTFSFEFCCLQVQKLNGPDIRTMYWTLGFVFVQVGLAYLVADLPWQYVIAVAITIGGLLAQSLTLAMHEISHNLAFKAQFPNLVLGMVANWPMGIPAFG